MLIQFPHIGRKLIRLDSIDSTNNYTANLVKSGELIHGSVILAVEQYAGRGQRGAVWVVKPGENLTFSLFLDEVNLSVDNQFKLTQFCSIWLVESLNNLGLKATIKWPNDIFVDGKKIAGMLIENQLKSGLIKSVIVGVGLNVNQIEFTGFKATSIKLLKGQFYAIDDILAILIRTFNELVDAKMTTEELNKKYLNLLYLKDIESEYQINGELFKGTITDVSPNGKLCVKINDAIQQFDLKEIVFMPQNEF